MKNLFLAVIVILPSYAFSCAYTTLKTRVAVTTIENDPTKYTLNDLSQTLSNSNSQGKQIRSFQIAIRRLTKNPE